MYGDLRSNDGSILWVYMPVIRNECVTEIWAVRDPEDIRFLMMGLMVR